jgi:hypothetical protein
VSTPKAQLVTRDADLSQSRPPRWVWQYRIVLGSLNLIIGDEDVGKGTLVCWLLARLTRGHLPGALRGKPIHVAVVGDEDSWNDVWVPKLHAAGADLSRCHLIERAGGGYVDMQRDYKELRHQIRENDVRVLFLDQLLDNLGAGVDDWRQKAVRDALIPFRSLASGMRLGLLCAMHPNKRADTFRRMMAGSAAFNAVSRSSLLLTKHPEDDSRRVLVRAKGNLSVTPPAVEFSIESYKFKYEARRFDVGRACGFSRSDLTAQDLVDATDTPRVKAQSKQGDARAMIGQLLPKDGKWHPCEPIFESCKGVDLDGKTVSRAKLKLGIEHKWSHTSPPHIEWRWPSKDTSKDTSGEST